jgi:hypothetical protein
MVTAGQPAVAPAEDPVQAQLRMVNAQNNAWLDKTSAKANRDALSAGESR